MPHPTPPRHAADPAVRSTAQVASPARPSGPTTSRGPSAGRWRAAALLLALGLAVPAFADGVADAQAQTQAQAQAQALDSFAAARGGDASRIEPAAVQLQALSRAAPGHPLWLAYAGAATAMQARLSWAPWTKMRHAEDGLAMLDRALALLTPAHASELHGQVPVALETRLTAASTFLALPAMFQRGERGRRLLAQVQADPALAATPARFQESVRQLAAKAQP